MSLRIFFLVLCAWMVGSFHPAFADPVSKGHKTPHGGILDETEGIHAELVIEKSGQPRLYLYDKAMKPLRPEGLLQVRLALKDHKGAQYSQELKPSGNPKEGMAFHGKPIQGLKDWDRAAVSLKIKERWIHLRFSHH